MRDEESGERRAGSGERRAESGERRAESGERRAESGERRAGFRAAGSVGLGHVFVKHGADQLGYGIRQDLEDPVVPAGRFVPNRDKAVGAAVVADVINPALLSAPTEFKPAETWVAEGSPAKIQ